jgi:O-ureido-D-serine cyclo-ligase
MHRSRLAGSMQRFSAFAQPIPMPASTPVPAAPVPRIAIVTAAAARDLDEDLPPLVAALRTQAEIRHDVVDWDDPAVDWASFDLVVLRSAWDYSQRLDEFLDWATRVATLSHLVNPLAVVRWNTDKHYLHDLAVAGVATVASVFIEPDQAADRAVGAFLQEHADAEFVVKPAVGAGSRDAQRYARADAAAAVAHAQRLLDARRSVLLQPYLERVDEHGETALIFVAGQYSHAIRKGPLLRRGEGPTRALFAAEHITPRTPDAAEIRLAERTLAAMPFGKPQPLLYARVDVIRDAADAPRVLELELTEPSLFFTHAAGSADRFVQALAQRACERAQRGA